MCRTFGLPFSADILNQHNFTAMKKFLFLLPSLLTPYWLLAQLVFRLYSLPVGTPANASFFVAGSFNNWSPGAAAYQLQNNQAGQPEISLSLPPGTYEYKFTRGSWATVEGNAQGGFRPNRSITYNGGLQVVEVVIASWEDQSPATHTAAPNVSVLSQSFFMPQLNRYRRIWIYLPPDYAVSDRDYPVLYMQDGQNLFDQATSFTGEWYVDETLNELFEQGDPGVIVVGIDNGGIHRIDEYTPWANPQYGGGQGTAYADFLAETLKPFIDANYRTLSGPAYTGVMGSSLGGLISLYTALRHPQVFGRAGVFSPSLWYTSDIFTYAAQRPYQGDSRICLMAGQAESTTMAAQVNNMYQTLLSAAYPAADLLRVIHADGQHAEWYWAREFGGAYQWLFAAAPTAVGEPVAEELSVYPNPSRNEVHVSDGGLRGLLAIVDLQGRLLRWQRLSGEGISLQGLPAGSYWLFLQQLDGRVSAARLQYAPD